MKKTLLLIEDDEPGRYAMSFLLEKAGYVVLQAATADEGYRHLLNGSPDAILLDVHLPDSDGYEVIKTIKKSPTLSTVPIVMMTATGDASDKVRAMALGCVAAFDKPVDMAVFVDQLAAALKREPNAPF